MAPPNLSKDEIFNAAAELSDPVERAAFLERACAGNELLRTEIEELLRHDLAAGSFLRTVEATRSTAEPPPGVTEAPGTVIGPYKLLEQIGEGGFGVVFMAEQTAPVKRKVALKVIKPGMDTWQVIARFEAERQALALMDHTNIARVFDAGATDTGRPFFVMELVKGLPITEYCDQNQLAPRERLELFVTICQAVQHAHQKGIIHRDIKPTNVLVTLRDDRPVVKVIDFGVAKATSGQLTDKTLFTGFAQMLGTPLYMSPEQAALSALDVDTRSDIYSLGVLLYELLTGLTPFDKARLHEAAFDEVRRIIREEEPQRPSTRLSDLGRRPTTSAAADGTQIMPATSSLASIAALRHTEPRKLSQLLRGELDWIVMKALEKDRNRRYATANDFAMDVQSYLADEPVLACPPSVGYRLKKFARRNKAVLTSATVMAGALLLAIVSLVSTVTVLAGNNSKVKKSLESEKEANANLRTAMARADRSLAYQRVALAERELAANNIGRAEELLTECPERWPGWEWHYLKRRARAQPQGLQISKYWVLDVAMSPDGRYLATASLGFLFQGEVKLSDPATGKELHRLRERGVSARSLAFSPDGSQLAAGTLDKTVVLWDVNTGDLVRTLKGHDGWVHSVAYSPDGKRLATASEDGTARIWNVSSGAEMLRLQDHGGSVQCVAYSPDGRRVASWGMDFTVRVWDADTGQEHKRLTGHSGRVFNLHFHKDGRHLVSAGADGMRIWDLKTDEMKEFRGVNNSCLRALFSPDGERLVAALWDSTIQVWDWRNDQEILTLRGHTNMVMSLAFSGDGRLLASAGFDGTVRLWNATPLTEDPPGRSRLLQGHHEGAVGATFSPDQRYLVTASLDGKAKLWDVASGKSLHTLDGLGNSYPGSGFYSGGKLLTTVTVDGTMIQWDVATGKRQRTWRGHLGPVMNTGFVVSFTADGERLASLTKDGSVGIWETASGKELVRLPAAFPPYFTVALSPDGRQLAAASVGSVMILDVKSGMTVATLPGVLHMAHYLTFSADGQRLAAAYWDGTIKVWDIKSSATLHTFRHGDRAMAVAFHPDGRQLASGSCDNTAKVWNLETGQEVETLGGHIGYVMCVAYSPDGQILATCSGHRYRGEVQLWEAAAFEKKR